MSHLQHTISHFQFKLIECDLDHIGYIVPVNLHVTYITFAAHAHVQFLVHDNWHTTQYIFLFLLLILSYYIYVPCH